MKYLLSNQLTPGEPVMTLNEFKTALRVDTTVEDTFLTTILQAATEEAEEYAQTSFMRQVRIAYVDAPQRFMQLNHGPVLEVVKIEYDDLNGQTQQWPIEDTVLLGDVLAPSGDLEWPPVGGRAQYPMRITYAAGQVDTTTSPPTGQVVDRVKAAVVLLGQSLYDRNPTTDESLRRSAHRLLDYSRNGQGM